MKLSLNIEEVFNRYGAEKSGILAKNAGFDAIDFSFMGMVHDGHPFLRDDYKDQAFAIKEAYDKVGIKVNQAHAPFSFPLELFHQEDAMKNLLLPRLTRSMEMASILGAEIIIIHPIHYWNDNCEEEALKKNIDFYRSFVPYCEKFDIKVAVENMWMRDPKRGYIIHDTCSRKEEFVRYIDEINSPYIVACLDVGHVALPRQQDEAQDVVYALGNKRLKALHLHDNDYKDDNHLLPFRGRLDWYKIGKALGEIGYDGYFTYEVCDRMLTSAPDELMPSLLKFYYDVLKYIAGVAKSFQK